MQLIKRLCHVAYDGANYHGFSISVGKKTIQQTIEHALEKIFCDDKISSQIDFTSRTDKGVHAIDQLISFTAPHYFENSKLLLILNQRLPLDIRVKSISNVSEGFNLRDYIKSKIYQYTISKDINDPFASRYKWILRELPAFRLLENLLLLMIGEHDFSSLAKESYRYNSTICQIYHIKCTMNLENEINIEIEGNRFLYNMIRRIIGFTVFLALREKSIPKTYEELISTYLHQTNMLAPASGLTLKKVILTSDS